MPDVPLSNAPRARRGALVQLVEDVIGIIPNIIVFQYNPEKVTRKLTPWNPFEVDQTNRGAQSPTSQPYDPEEMFTFNVVFDAADDLADGEALATATGIAARLAALRKLTKPTEGLIGDLLATASALAGDASKQTTRSTVPVVLLVLGPGVILPVRVTSFSVDEEFHSPLLYPLRATVSLSLQVLTPDTFKCQQDVTTTLAIAAYNMTQLQDDALAILNIANNVEEITGMLPL